MQLSGALVRVVGVAIVAASLQVPTAPAALAATRVDPAEFVPLPGAADLEVSPEALALRAEVLGPGHDDPDLATLHWVGVSSFVVTWKGHLFLLDAWEIIGATNDTVPIGREELAALEPEAVFIGHGDFDHAGDLGYVAGLSGAVVIGGAGHCDTAEAGAEREGVPLDFVCVVVGDAETVGDVTTIKVWEDVEPVTILQHIHSDPAQPGEDNPIDPQVPIFDPTPYAEHFATDPNEFQRFFGQLEEGARDAILLHHFKEGDFTLLWGNSAGPIHTEPSLIEALDTVFPGCVDVMSNAILGFDQPVSGLHDPALYVEYAHPKVFLPTHGDAWAPVISAGQAQYQGLWDEQMADLENPPETDFLLDPQDYLAERAYAFDDPRWVEPMAGSSCAAAAPVVAPEPQPAVPGPSPDPEPEPLPATGGGVVIGALLVLAPSLLPSARSRRRGARVRGR